MFNTKLKYIVTAIIITTILSIVYLNSTKQDEKYLKIIEHNGEENTEYDDYKTPRYFEKQKLFNMDNFHYILNNKNTCDNETTVHAVILVTSYFGNVEARSAMRRAFSNDDLKQLNFRRVFLLGRAPSDKYTTQKSIENESQRFGDLIQGSFIEAYKNLTYKHIMGLKWAAEYCSAAKFTIKMDDDIVVNIERVPKLLDSFKVSRGTNFIAGYILRNMVAIREPANKWYVTQDEYEFSTYPPFVSGWFYVTTPQTAGKLVKHSEATKYFWIDDTYVTGILAKQLKIRHYDIGKHFAVHSEYMECCLDDIQSKNLNCDILVGPNGGNNNLFYNFNNAVALPVSIVVDMEPKWLYREEERLSEFY
ncbi:hypothetical protein JTB14_012125 [Gonioctena quinquepunctata]|nr:hypothetical protein JTB14_012125 [Gonioctena quinquepunctata]